MAVFDVSMTMASGVMVAPRRLTHVWVESPMQVNGKAYFSLNAAIVAGVESRLGNTPINSSFSDAYCACNFLSVKV